MLPVYLYQFNNHWVNKYQVSWCNFSYCTSYTSAPNNYILIINLNYLHNYFILHVYIWFRVWIQWYGNRRIFRFDYRYNCNHSRQIYKKKVALTIIHAPGAEGRRGSTAEQTVCRSKSRQWSSQRGPTVPRGGRRRSVEPCSPRTDSEPWRFFSSSRTCDYSTTPSPRGTASARCCRVTRYIEFLYIKILLNFPIECVMKPYELL